MYLPSSTGVGYANLCSGLVSSEITDDGLVISPERPTPDASEDRALEGVPLVRSRLDQVLGIVPPRRWVCRLLGPSLLATYAGGR